MSQWSGWTPVGHGEFVAEKLVEHSDGTLTLHRLFTRYGSRHYHYHLWWHIDRAGKTIDSGTSVKSKKEEKRRKRKKGRARRTVRG